jgi:hypothetical protein
VSEKCRAPSPCLTVWHFSHTSFLHTHHAPRTPPRFATYRDGGILTPSKATQCVGGNTVNCTAKLQPDSNEVGYVEEWRGRIVAENPERYHVPTGALDARKVAVMSGKRKGRQAYKA